MGMGIEWLITPIPLTGQTQRCSGIRACMPAHGEADSDRRAPNRPPGDAVGFHTCRRSHPGRVSWLRYAGCRGLFLNKSPCQHQLGPGSELSSKTPPLSGGSSRRNRAKRPPRVTVSGLNLPASVGLSRIALSTPGGLGLGCLSCDWAPEWPVAAGPRASRCPHHTELCRVQWYPDSARQKFISVAQRLHPQGPR